MTTEQKREAVAILYDAIEQHGLVQTLHTVFGGRLPVSISLSRAVCDTEVAEMELSVRAYNCLRRANITTVGELADMAMEGKLSQLRNMGAKTVREIQTKLLCYAYHHAAPAWRREFLENLINANLSKGAKTGK